jgi:dTMP kinase
MLLFDADVLLAQQRRARERGQDDRIESRGLGFQESVRRAFLAGAAREPERIVVIDATPGAHEVHQQVLEAVEAALSGTQARL